MSIFGRIRAAVKALSGAQLVMEPHFRQISFSQFTMEETDADLIKHFVHWVYVCSTKNAAGMASVPLRLYVTTGAADSKQYKYLRRGIDTRSVNKARLVEMEKHNPLLAQRISKAVEVEEVTQHPFLELWSAVNPFMNGFEMIELLDIYQELTGDAFLHLPPTPLGIPQELWVLQNQYVTIVPDKKNFIKGYLYGSNKHNAKALAADEVIHFKFPNPHSIFNGFSPVQGGISAITRKEDMDAYEHSLLQNNARPDFLILAKKKMSGPDKLALREQWQQLYGTKQGRGRPALLDTDASIETLGFSPRDMAFVQGQKHTKEEICSTFGVPVSKVVPDAKYTNAEIGDREWKADTIRPRLRRMADKLNEKLLVRYDGRLFVAFDDPVPEDREYERLKEESYLKNAVITINEVREKEGKTAVPWGRVPIQPFNMIPFGSAPPEPAPVAPEEASMKTTQKIRRPPMTRIPEMTRIMRRIYRGIEAEVIANLNRGKQIKQAPEDVWFIFDGAKWELEVIEQMGKPIKAQLVTGGQYGLDQLRMGLRFDVMNPETQRWLRQYVAHFGSVTTEELGLKFSREMLVGMEQGETIFELRKRTEKFFGRMKTHKSEMIARTESSRGSHQGMLQGWKQSGVVTAKVWQTQPGACQFCEPMQGKVVELERSFFEQGSVAPGNQGGNLKLDYEIVEGPPLHPNCICTLTAVVKE